MSPTLIVAFVAVIVAGMALAVQLMPRRKDLAARPTEPIAPAPAPAADTAPKEAEPVAPTPTLPPILVDTSAIIDGRIADIATAGFIPGRLVVPRFVLAELQNIADSDDAMRRGRGRRGLDVLNTLRELPDVDVEIIEDDVPKVREVDAKLVVLAQKFSCNVLTTDYNLNRVAQIQGVRVLNVNELSNAIRPVVLPGEELLVRVVQPGKERHQGVGYLADGTMIVVENGDKMIGQEVPTEVTRVFQTVAGKMIFAVPRGAATGAPAAAAPMPAALTEAPASPKPAAKPVAVSEDQSQAKPNHHRPNNSNNAGSTPKAALNFSRAGSQADIENRLIAATNEAALATDFKAEARNGNRNNHRGHRSAHRPQNPSSQQN